MEIPPILTIISFVVIAILLSILKKENEIVKQERKEKAELKEKYRSKIELKENELGTHIQTIENYQASKNELETNYERLKNDYLALENIVDKHKAFSRNIGEVMASRDLNMILEAYKERGVINHYHIIDNILFSDNEIRQIDHLLVCDYGIYMIETKTWKGDIFYNANKKALQNTEYKLFQRYLFNENFDKEYKTFVLKNDEKNQFKAFDYGNPYKQVKKSVYKIYNHFDKKYFVNGLVYFNYKSENESFIFFDGSEANNPIKAVNQIENLIGYFDDKFKNSKKCIDENEINEVVSKIAKYIIL